MSVSRRRFIKSGTLTALTAGFIFKTGGLALGQNRKPLAPTLDYQNPTVDFPIPYEAQQNPVFSYKSSTFEPYVNGIFVARDARGRAIELKLVRVSVYKPARNTRIMTTTARETDCFSLLFSAPRSLPEFTSIHSIEHAALGKFDLFLKRSEDREQLFYEAVVNHL